jgi:hypothetical protein
MKLPYSPMFTLLIVAGCTGALNSSGLASPAVGTPATNQIAPPSFEPAPTPPRKPPVDPSIASVSASKPSPSAKVALEACGVYEFGLQHVAGMGQVPHGTDAVRFGLSASAPLLHVDTPVWIVQLQGEFPQPPSDKAWIDPTCVVVDGEPALYATGPIRDLRTGKIERAYWPERGVASLPELAP